MSKTVYLLSEKGLPFPPKGSTFFAEKVDLFEESNKPLLQSGSTM